MNRLPAGYRLFESLDFVRNRKQMITICLLSVGTIVLMIAIGLILHPIADSWHYMLEHWWTFFVLAAMQFAYIPLHELVHGLWMRLFSKEKVQYGFQLCYAYAGSRAYFNVAQHNFVALAPLITWGIVIAVLEHALPQGWFWMLYSVQIANVSGSVGDLYCVWRTLFYPRGSLIQDTGVRMRVYAPHTKEDNL